MNNESIYILKHKNENVGLITLDPDQGTVVSFKASHPELGPYLGTKNPFAIKGWWQKRAIPGSRNSLNQILGESGCDTNFAYLAKNLGLSMTDCYWICPMDSELTWENVSLFQQIGQHDRILPVHNQSSFDPNASLGGQLEKYWDLSEKIPQLIKTTAAYYGQQSINEEFASWIHERQNSKIPFVKYHIRARKADQALQSVCDSFATEQIEFVPALEVFDSQKASNGAAPYDHFSNVCDAHGIDAKYVRDFLDYQTLTDFLITNTDRHLFNFGILRDSASLQFVDMAPIYDSGNSMFFMENMDRPLSRIELLDRKITAIHKSEERMLQSVNRKDLIDLDAIPDTHEVREFYASRGVPEKKAHTISQNYESKALMLDEFAHGKKISLYNEKNRDYPIFNRKHSSR